MPNTWLVIGLRLSPAPTWFRVLAGTLVTSRATCAGAGTEPSERWAALAAGTRKTSDATHTSAMRPTPESYPSLRVIATTRDRPRRSSGRGTDEGGWTPLGPAS